MACKTSDYDELLHEHQVLLAAHGQAQARCSTLLARQAAEIAKLQAQLLRLRAEVLRRDTALAFEREDRAALEASLPGLPRRRALIRHVEALRDRLQRLLGSRSALQPPQPAPAKPPPAAPDALREKSVLCVGRDAVQLIAAQHVVELAGCHFLHHDGSDADEHAALLESSLLAADLVICQTGCVSHGAYWRVQDHCRRTGKRCVLVEQPQALHFVRRPAPLESEPHAPSRPIHEPP
ncbi:DUF2325 domain-containing protein [Xylophilus sp. ASV27]|uniref:DUF2325 domain-containing protein n=1 Tax=Xylophilus sp. ASV27 TaxID=2795129 RepID=UPI0018ECD8A0